MIGEMSEEEFEVVKQEITERLKDMVYATAEAHVEEALSLAKGRILKEDSQSEITITFRVTMCCGDIQQIVARMRRSKE